MPTKSYNKGYSNKYTYTTNKSNGSKTKSTNSNNKQHYVYTLNLKGGNKYVGMTSDLPTRIQAHFNGDGAKWTQKHEPVSINSITRCKNYQSARQAETTAYYNMKNYHGTEKVRGAGYCNSK